ncbi:MAG: hypothetical protein WAV72_24985 [Bradyrhizobium sp.]
MIRLFSNKTLIASAIALGAVVVGSAAHARSDVTLVVDLNSPHRYVQPAPVFVQHQQMPLQAHTVYTQPQTVQFGHDGDRFDRNDRRGRALNDADRDGIPNKFDRDSRFYDARATWRHAQWGDFDRDGVVNQFDRAPRNPRRH